MAKKQERRAKRGKAADQAAEQIMTYTVAKWASERADAATDDEYALGCQVRELREAGNPWWAIAQVLGLPGSGDSAKAGKLGAGRARRAYARAFGSYPRTFERGAPKAGAEKNEHVKAVQQRSRKDRKAAVAKGKAVVDLTLTDEELAEVFRGRRITWTTNGLFGMEPIDETAWVHPDFGVSVTGEGPDRILNFREYHSTAPVEHRAYPAQQRTIRVSQIHTIGGRQLTTTRRDPKPSKRKQREARQAKAAS